MAVNEWLASNATSILAILALGSAFVAIVPWYAKVNSDRKNFKEFMSETKNTLNSIDKKFEKLYSLLISKKTVINASPLRLTELGEKVSQEISAKEWAKREAEKLRPQVVDMTENFELHDAARSYVHQKYEPSEDESRNWKRCAYENGIEFAAVLEVLVVELRDVLINLVLEAPKRMH